VSALAIVQAVIILIALYAVRRFAGRDMKI
jgi:hypothetical protein